MNSHPCSRKDCVLYAEDDESDVFLVKHALKRAGFVHPLQVVQNGQQALDYLAGNGEFADRTRYPMPCVVLLDIKMPRMTGLDVLKWVRHQPGLAGLVVIIFTSSHHEPDVERAYRLGANAFLVKPSDADELLEVAQLLKTLVKHNQFPAIQARSNMVGIDPITGQQTFSIE
jgi:CheY-like chemotaxis protein